MELLQCDQFVLRIGGSWILMRRNRTFLRLYNPFSTNIKIKILKGCEKKLTKLIQGQCI